MVVMNPIRKRVVLTIPGSAKQKEVKLESGLYLVSHEPPKNTHHIVREIGADVDGVKVGDKVMVNPAAGIKVQVSGEEVLIVNEADIILVVDDGAAVAPDNA